MSHKQAERIEIDRQSHGTDTNSEEKLYTLGQQAQNKTAGKVCFSLVELFRTLEEGSDEMSSPGEEMLDV